MWYYLQKNITLRGSNGYIINLLSSTGSRGEIAAKSTSELKLLGFLLKHLTKWFCKAKFDRGVFLLQSNQNVRLMDLIIYTVYFWK